MKTRRHRRHVSKQVEDQFVELWNNMASLWGISPTMARIHGLLYITGAALSMDDIMARLAHLARQRQHEPDASWSSGAWSAASTSAATAATTTNRCSDVWEMFTLVANQRKRREIDPILNTLRRCRDELTPETIGGQAAKEPAQKRFQRDQRFAEALTLLDGLSQRFFESHKGLREAVEMLTSEE